MAKRTVNKNSVRYWDKKLWKIFSEYIRRKDADENGEVECYTCYTKRHWKQLHAGHFVSRNAKAIKFDEQNVKPQCPSCNTFNEGMSWQFGQNLDRDYGEGTAENLEAQRHSIRRWTIPELEELYNEYKKKVDKLP